MIRPGFNPDFEAEALHKSVQGLGTDDARLIETLAHMSRDERLVVAECYRRHFQSDLYKDVSGDTSGNYRELLEKLLLPRPEAVARCLHEAMDGFGTNDFQLITLLVAFPLDIPAAVAAYKRMYKRDLLEDIKGDTSGDYQKALVALVTRVPLDPNFVDSGRIAADVEALYNAGEKRLGTDEDAFINILAGRSNAHLVAVNAAYAAAHKNTLNTAIVKETSGNLERVLVSLVIPRYEFLASAVRHAVRGAGTEERLLHIIFALCEKPELQFIAGEYKRVYKKDMAEDIKSDTSFNFERLLTSLL